MAESTDTKHLSLAELEAVLYQESQYINPQDVPGLMRVLVSYVKEQRPHDPMITEWHEKLENQVSYPRIEVGDYFIVEPAGSDPGIPIWRLARATKFGRPFDLYMADDYDEVATNTSLEVLKITAQTTYGVEDPDELPVV